MISRGTTMPRSHHRILAPSSVDDPTASRATTIRALSVRARPELEESVPWDNSP